ncbi:MAG: PAC2 family protein [Candidatus Bathyarchaeota archaeon]|jgi:hypothetical protein
MLIRLIDASSSKQTFLYGLSGLIYSLLARNLIMVCDVVRHENPELNDPILIEGLPGIGFVANIVALHLIRELDAKLFAEITSSSFQDLAVTTDGGRTQAPINQLYYHKNVDGGRDLIIWYGNTQALTTFGQYELCGHVLDMVEKLGCRYVITLGGFRHDGLEKPPRIYCAASNGETIKTALELGAKIMVGQIFGIAGITVGLAELKGMKAFSLLIETPGTHPDVEAARQGLDALCRFLDIKVDGSKLNAAAEETNRILEAFGLINRRMEREDKKKEESELRWYV